MSNAATLPTPNTTTSSKGLHIGLWVTQVLVGLSFIMGGAMKLAMPVEELAAQMPWVSGVMGSAVRFIGLAELLGGIGVILPAATRIKPVLTPLAASGLLVIMVLAAVTHIARGEYPMIVVNLVLGGMAAFVAWGRFKKAPIQSRS